ncbi:hypothetical protein OKW24_003895 [Peribacillus simplex]|nr:hypothetical protein [Peribacillus simplex]
MIYGKQERMTANENPLTYYATLQQVGNFIEVLTYP